MAGSFIYMIFMQPAAIFENFFVGYFLGGLHWSFNIKFLEKIPFALVHLYYEDTWDVGVCIF